MLSRRELLLLLALFIASLPAVTARLYSSDEVEYFSYLRSLWFDRDVSFENEYQYFYDHRIAQTPDFHQTFLELETATGRRINYGTIGCAILWAPFYAVGDLATRAMRSMGSTSSTSRMRAVETTAPPATGVAPPDRPVPAPRPTTGTPLRASTRIARAHSSVVRGRSTISGRWCSSASPSAS